MRHTAARTSSSVIATATSSTNDYLDEFVRAGLKPVGVNPDTNLVEAVEMQDHPWFIGVQYHPEYKSTALHPHPLFVSFVKASTQYCKDNNGCK